MNSNVLICATNTKQGRRYADTFLKHTGGQIVFWEDMAVEIRSSEGPVFQCNSAWSAAPPVDAISCFRDRTHMSVAEMIETALVPVPLAKPAITVWCNGRDLLSEHYDLAILVGWYGDGSFGHYGDLAMIVGTLLHDAGTEVWNRETYNRAWRTKIGLTFLLARSGYLVPDTLYAPDPSCALACMVPGLPYVVKDASGTHGKDNYLTNDPVQILDALKSHRSLVQRFIPNDHDLRVICFGSKAYLVMNRSRADNTTHLNNTTVGGSGSWVDDIPDCLREISHGIAELSYADMAGIDFIETHMGQDTYYWCLEVNVIPQLISGFDAERKLSALGMAVRERLASKTVSDAKPARVGCDRKFKLAVHRRVAQLPGNSYLEYIKQICSPDLDSRILVEIPAFCDPELVSTIQSAILTAANPKRIHFAVCYQSDDLEMLQRVQSFPNCKVKYFSEHDAPGLCAARYEASCLLDGEEYVLHIDSHMRFSSFWDVAVIDQFNLCPGGKHVLSGYPLDYANFAGEPIGSDVFDLHASAAGVYCNFSYFHGDAYKPRFAARRRFDGPDPRVGAFISGGFLFGRSSMDIDVLSDPNMFFTGDEAPIAMRLWTNGYDIYQPGVRCVYHLYCRDKVARNQGAAPVNRFSGDRSGNNVRSTNETLRMEQLFGIKDHGIDMGRFGLGFDRTLDDYYLFSGVDYRNRSARMFAYDGDFSGSHSLSDMEFACVEGKMTVGPHKDE